MSELNVYSASAGSGKTYTLARTVIDLLARDPLSYDHLLAVTFTNKATAEMKERIVGDLHLMTDENDSTDKRKALIDHHMKSTGLDENTLMNRCRMALRGVLYDYGRFSVSTIDKFVQQVLRSFAFEQGLTANYMVSLDTDDVVASAMTDLMEELRDNKDLCQHLVNMIQARMGEDKSWNVESDIKDMGKLLLTDAGEYLRDKETLTREHLQDLHTELKTRIERCYIKLLELADELAMEQDRCQIVGLHGKNYPQKMLDKRPKRRVVEDETRESDWIKSAFDRLAGLNNDYVTSKTTGDTDSFKAAMQRIKDNTIPLRSEYNALKAIMKHVNTMAVMGDLARKISDVEERCNIHSLGTSGEMLRELIDGSTVPFIYEKCGARYDTIMIDEFQDTSRTQYENFEPLLRNSLGEGHDCLIVGDVKQSIYRFREGDWRLLGQRIENDFNEARHRPLTDNYRSKNEIVTMNNALFDILPKIMDNAIAPPPDTADTMTAMYNESRQTPHRGNGGYAMLTILNLADKTQNGTNKDWDDHICSDALNAIQRLHNDYGYLYSDMCVLVRNRRDSVGIVKQLSDNGIAVMSEDSLLVMSNNATQFMADAMRYLSSSEDAPLFSAILAATNLTADQLANNWLAQKEQWATKIEALRGLDLLETGGALINMMPKDMCERDMPYIDALMQNMRDAIANGINTIEAFVELINDKEESWVVSATSGEDAVRIMTIHKSKGLEFKVVLIPYAGWEIQSKTEWKHLLWVPADKLNLESKVWHGKKLPVNCSKKDLLNTPFADEYAQEVRADFEDNLNLIYVALTRPTDILMLWGVNTTADGSDSAGSMATYLHRAMRLIDPNTTINIHQEDIQSTNPNGEPISATALTAQIGSLQMRSGSTTQHDETVNVSMSRIYMPSDNPSVNTQVEMVEYERSVNMVSYGLTMHGILERIRTTNDIHDAIQNAVAQGLLLNSDIDNMEAELNRRLTDTPVKAWFDGSMTNVWAETTMVGPDKRLRPDRIMRDTNANTVIVDYKFGHRQRDEHIAQVLEYKQWLNNAGFNNIKAYLWYYSLSKVVEV